MDEISKRRWERNEKPDDHKPIDALRVAIHDIESGKIAPNHIVIVYANNADQDGATGYYQAGDAGYHGSLGILARGMQLIGGDG